MPNQFDKYLDQLSDKERKTIENMKDKEVEIADDTSPSDIKPRHEMTQEQTQETIRDAGRTLQEKGLETDTGSLSKYQCSQEQMQDQEQSREQDNQQENDQDNER